jgi:hypothetical protein
MPSFLSLTSSVMVRQEVVTGTMCRVDINVILKVAVPIENLVEYVLGSWAVPFLGMRNENYNCPQNIMRQCCRGVRCDNIIINELYMYLAWFCC